MEYKSVRRNKFTGVAGKVMMLAIIPALVMALMNFYSTNQMTSLADTATNTFKRFANVNNTIILSSNRLKDTMFGLLNNVKILTRQHQSSLMRHDKRDTWVILSSRNRVQQSIEDYSNAIKTLDARLTKIREVSIERNITAQVYDNNIRFMNFLVRSEANLRYLFDQFTIQNDQTLLYLESDAFEQAIDSYVYEEEPILRVIEALLTRMSSILSDMVSDINQVQSLNQEARNVEVSTEINQLLNVNYSMLIAVTLILISLAILYSQFQLSLPLRKMISVMEKLSLGDTMVDIPEVGDDEVGDIARALSVFKKNAIDKKKLEKDKEEQQQRLQNDKRLAIQTLASNFEESVKQVVSTVTGTCSKLGATADQLASNANDSQGQAHSLKNITSNANDNVHAVAEAMEGLNRSIQEISQNVIRSADITQLAKQQAMESNATVTSLLQATEKIDNVVQFIIEISSQINLLALNASIEAARAGEAGKGFSVVATEVQLLANQTVKATEQITSEILGIQESTKDTANKIQNMTKIIAEMNEISSSVASTVSEQASTTSEISNNVSGAAKGTLQLSDNAVLVSDAASKTGTYANDTLSSVQELLKQSTVLQKVVDEFLERLHTQAT